MFKVICDKIYFNDTEVATLQPWLKETLRWDMVYELEGHVKVQLVEGMRDRLAALEALTSETDVHELLGAQW